MASERLSLNALGVSLRIQVVAKGCSTPTQMKQGGEWRSQGSSRLKWATATEVVGVSKLLLVQL